jgi:NAD(P)-dependent dehydrogenase (short-subunit alcohol dehydrogenase family)
VELRGRTAVVTGGASGIGRALILRVAREGANVVVADLDEAGAASVAGEAQALGVKALAVRVDVSELGQVETLAARAFETFGAVHVLCNNAGVAAWGGLETATHRDWQWVLGVNLWGVVHGVEAFVPRMIARGEPAHIVNTASMAGLVGMRWLGIYSASKFAVVGLTEALHREVADQGIGVTVLCPMIVRTDINENSARRRPQALRNPGEPLVPAADAMAGGVIEPAEVARRVVRGIERRDLYVLTHPEQREILRRRWMRQDRLFEPEVW